MKKYFFWISIFLIIYFMSAAYNEADWDLWHRLAAGKLFWEIGVVPKVDIFAYTPTKELWIDHEWGAGAVFYFLVKNFSGVGLCVLKFFLITLTFLPVFLVNRLKNSSTGIPARKKQYRITFYLLFFYAILFGFLDTLRSQAFTFAFFAIWLYFLELVRKGNNKLLLAFPVMTVIWANLHGGFLAGLGILTLYGIGEALNRRAYVKYLLTALMSGALTLINPYGIKYWQYLVEAVTLDRVFIAEWQPLLSGEFVFALGFKVILLLTIIALPYVFIKNRREINWAEMLILAVTCWLSFKHARHNVFFVIASAAYMQEYIYSAFKYYFSFLTRHPENCPKELCNVGIFSESPFKKATNNINLIKEILIYFVIICLGFLTVFFVPLKVNVSEKRYPVKSVEFIRQNGLSGNLLVLFNWGGYSLWKLYPHCRIALDGRYEEVYSTELVNESARFHYVGRDWKDFMKKYKADLMLIDKSYPVFTELLRHDDWKIVYQDKVSAVFLPIGMSNERWVMPKTSPSPVKEVFISDIEGKEKI